MSTILNVTELDFEQIKTNLKTYLKNQDGFTDYDFEGSGLNILLDVLAYNTHYNAVNAHYTLNEAFLDSAQIRGNVVTRAKVLGYTPRSTLTPIARINIVITAGGTHPPTLTLPRGTKFSTTVDNSEYNFVTMTELVAPQVATTEGVAPNEVTTYTYNFENVEIKEGTLKKVQYTVNNIIENQKYQVSDTDVDTTTLLVKVKSNSAALNSDTYTVYEDLSITVGTTQVYFLQQNANEYYEIYFGDGVTGKRPVTSNIVELEYVISSANAANGAQAFTLASTILSGSTNVTTTVAAATGGQIAETLESIRFNAPLKFASQNRAVSADDYRAILKAEYSNIDAISVWGGENNTVPDYGSVYIAIKPLTGDTLTETDKAIVMSMLKGKTVTTVKPVIVDTEYTYIELDVNVRYNPNLTAKTNNELVTAVTNTLATYGTNKLNDFDGVFRHSQVTQTVDATDPAILSSSVRPRMFKLIKIRSDEDFTADLQFAEPLYSSGNIDEMSITSTPFLRNGVKCYIGDSAIVNTETKRSVIIYTYDEGGSVAAIKTVGTLDLLTGIINMSDFRADINATVKIAVVPNSLDIAPKREQLVAIDTNYSTIVAEIDTIATSGQSGAIAYTTTPRLR